jgi:three-Cys-motif partner protein
MAAMVPKRAQGKWDKLVYFDLLCGPGKCIDRDTLEECDGSPIRALKVRPAFDHLYFSDSDKKNIAALKKRMPQAELVRVTCQSGDCNSLIREFLSDVSDKTLGLAFLDPQGFEVQFETLKLLATKRIDILYLFPSGIGIARNLGRFVHMTKTPMESFWGPDWKDLPAAKLAAGKKLTPREIKSFDRPWVKTFRQKVATLGFTHQDEDAPILLTETDTLMYHLLFFSKDKAGLKIWRGIKEIDPNKQRNLPFERGL